MKKKIAIIQSNYIPWKGYFDAINTVDEFVLFDDVQYTKRDWRNRNIIITKDGPRWLTIPVLVKGLFHQKIKDVVIKDHDWARKHWNILLQSYNTTENFSLYRENFEQLYSECSSVLKLSEVNYKFIKLICGILNIKTKIIWSYDYKISKEGKSFEGKTKRLIDICKQSASTDYYSGPAAKNYIQEDLFKKENIQLHYFNYSGYPEYTRSTKDFSQNVSIIDLIFNMGATAPTYMKSFSEK